MKLTINKVLSNVLTEQTGKIEGEILAPLKSLAKLPLTSTEPGFHPETIIIVTGGVCYNNCRLTPLPPKNQAKVLSFYICGVSVMQLQFSNTEYFHSLAIFICILYTKISLPRKDINL